MTAVFVWNLLLAVGVVAALAAICRLPYRLGRSGDAADVLELPATPERRQAA
jgi:hypothetical protein